MTTETETIMEATAARDVADAYLREAASLFVNTAEDYDEASKLRAEIKHANDDAETDRKGQKEPHLREGQRIDAAFKPALEMFTSAAKVVDNKLRTYRTAEETRRKAAELEAREAAEKERLRLEKQAAKAEAKGMQDTADELTRIADSIEAPAIASHVPKLDDMSVRVTWKFEITNADLIPREYLEIDEQAIGRVVRALKSNARIPGVRVYPEESFVSARGNAS